MRLTGPRARHGLGGIEHPDRGPVCPCEETVVCEARVALFAEIWSDRRRAMQRLFGVPEVCGTVAGSYRRQQSRMTIILGEGRS